VEGREKEYFKVVRVIQTDMDKLMVFGMFE
jgi:hypothetical protein